MSLHEAAHATCILALGGKIQRVTRNHIWYYTDGLSPHDVAVISLDPAMLLKNSRTLSDKDLQYAKEYLGDDPYTDKLKSVHHEATTIVNTWRAEIEALAKLIDERGQLTGDEVARCVLDGVTDE